MASDVLWIMQTNLGSGSDIQDYVSAVKHSGASVAEVFVIPFSGDLPEVQHHGPVILYGSVSFVTRAHESRRWHPGAFSHPDTFTYEGWCEHYGDLLLNSPDSTIRMSVADFLSCTRTDEEPIFVRPVRDAKEINGGVWTAGEFRDWCGLACQGVLAGVGPETRIIVGKPYGIEAEWRLFVAGGEIVGASQYRRSGVLSKTGGAPAEILEFGAMAAKLWNPAPIYVLDVCLSAGRPYIVEAQGFNSAGHYGADLNRVVEAANAAAVGMFADLQDG